MSALHQFVPTLEPGAVGTHSLHLRSLIRELGHESEIFAEHFHPSMRKEGRRYPSYGRKVPAGGDDVLLYQLAIGSAVGDFVAGRPERLLVNYHNITPVRYFAAWEPPAVYGLAWGRSQLAALASRCALAIAASAYNEGELRAAGYRQSCTVPVLFEPGTAEPEAALAARLASAKERGGAEWLFVGRIAPNKAQHDLVKALAVYRRLYDPLTRLTLVGGSSSHAYWSALRRLTAALSLTEAVRLPGSVSDSALAAYYANADVFVCASEHEGLCVPLLEAMHYDLPVVAFGAAAVPETLAGAGLVLTDKEPATLAAAVSRITSDSRLRARVVAAGRSRLADFSFPKTRARFAELIGSFRETL